VRAGEPHALLELYRRHGAVVYAVARQRCGSDCAEAVTRDVFLRLWLAPDQWSPEEESLRRYLVAEASAEGASRTTERAGSDAADPTLVSLAALPASESDVVALVLGGFTYRDAAALLRQGEPQVRRRGVSGLKRLAAGAAGPHG